MFQKKFWIGCLGFLGFFGMRYVSSGNILDLAYLGFFAFFGFFFVGRISGDRRDERYQENRKTALAFVGQLSIMAFFVIWGLGVILGNMEVVFVLSVLAYAGLLNAYAIKLYWLEEK